MTDQYGVTPSGFVAKPLEAILTEAFARARQAFGPDVDLRSAAPLRKIIEVAAAEDALLWMRMEDSYYAGFIPTAVGRQLDHHGADLGMERQLGHSSGTVTVTLADAARPGCAYVVPLGTVVETAAGTQFRTTGRLVLNSVTPSGDVAAVALRRGMPGDVRSGEIAQVNPAYADRYLRLPGGMELTVRNSAAFEGGAEPEDDPSFRRRLMDRPRAIWTAEALREAALAVDGVRDCAVWDPYGGLDRTGDWFGGFRFGQRAYSGERHLCSPYFFDVVVALEPGAVWAGEPGLPGVRDEVLEALADRRPVSVFPELVRATDVEIGAEAAILVAPGQDERSVLAEARRRVTAHLLALPLGADVLAAEILCVVMGVPGVSDVRELRLRRCPPRFGLISFGPQPRFQDGPTEAGCGENLPIDTREAAVPAPDGLLFRPGRP